MKSEGDESEVIGDGPEADSGTDLCHKSEKLL